MIINRVSIRLLLLMFTAMPAFAHGNEPTPFKELGKDFESKALPVLQRYCQKCHSAEKQEGDLDLKRFGNLEQVRGAQRVWQKVAEMLDNGEMPPKEARQPSDAERTRLRQWVRGYLTAEATALAGDPGRVVLRRLSNAEYTYTLRDLTGVASLDPAREFPVDGAAGEGFTNTGNALVMSPALVTKYLDAAKEVASHAVLLPDGFRFSASTTRRDWTEENLKSIREFYRDFTDARGGNTVNLQGIVLDTNQGGRLPVQDYITATIIDREALKLGGKSIEAVAREHRLNARYLGTLWQALSGSNPSLLLDQVRARWREAKPADAPALAAEIAAWQKGLWKFGTVGHIGKVGGPKAWMEAVSPLIPKQELGYKIPASIDGKDVTVSLVARDAGDGNEHDFVLWKQPRIVSPGRPDLLLRDVRDVTRTLRARRQEILASSAKYLIAADEAAEARGRADLEMLARKNGLEADALRAWLDYLGIGSGGIVALSGHFTNKLTNSAGYAFVNGWGTNETPLIMANSSDQHVRIPGNMKPHSVAVHPSPTLRAAVGWRSPVTAKMRLEAMVTHAHPECGNGVTWSLELRRGATRKRLASGTAQGSKEMIVGPHESTVQIGDLVSLLIGSRDGNHSCDLTAVELKATSAEAHGRTWSLVADVSNNVLAGNPHSDRFGNEGVWHFYMEPENGGGGTGPVIPPGSLIAKWQTARNAAEKEQLAEEFQRLMTSGPPAAKAGPDAALYRQLTSLSGPLFGGMMRVRGGGSTEPFSREGFQPERPGTVEVEWGLEPGLFGKHPRGLKIDPDSLCVRAPSVLTFRLPAELVSGCELVTTGMLEAGAGAEGSVQLAVVADNPGPLSGLQPSEVTVTVGNGEWTAYNRRISFDTPIVVNDKSASRKRIEDAFDDFRRLFPAALCYTKIVPVDEVVTLTLFYREDDHLARLMLDDAQKKRLDRLWDELHYIGQDALTLVDAFAQLMEYATQDADPKVFEPLRKPINDRASAFRRTLIDTEPKHLDALLEFAARAYRRPLTEPESRQIHQLYASLRTQELPHDEAFRLTLARVLVAPAFLYRVEKPGSGTGQGPVSDTELASRLSYFLWSSEPDNELMQLALAGRLRDTDTLVAQTRRMLKDARTRRLAIEFACQWLHISDFNHLDEKSERHFPTFAGLRGAMYEESIQFFTELFRNNGSVLDILDADFTFLNGALAKHYGIPIRREPPLPGQSVGIQPDSAWHRVDGVKQYGRGGILGQATTLSKQSGASRTSPILRGNWISEVLLGERLPRPPKGVPVLPEDETTTKGLTVRQLVEQHSSNPKCVVCHQRIDPFGFSLEGFDAIGRRREKDMGGRPIDTRVKAMDGAQFEGLEGLRDYLLKTRRDSFLRQYCRKLLGYALGRSVQLSDEPVLAEMLAALKENNYSVVSIVEVIVRSRQFREIRGREAAYTD